VLTDIYNISYGYCSKREARGCGLKPKQVDSVKKATALFS
jgi:hypothetical protein